MEGELLRTLGAQLRHLSGLPGAEALSDHNWTCGACRGEPPVGSAGAQEQIEQPGRGQPPRRGLCPTPLEASMLQIGCARSALRAVVRDLDSLARVYELHGRLAARRGRDDSRLRRLAAEAARLAERAVWRASTGHHAASCAVGRRALAMAQAALRHPVLLPTEYFSEDHTVSVYAPLFFPVASTVGAALMSEARRRMPGG